MDLRLFHPVPGPGRPDTTPRDYKMKDRLNGWTHLLPCRFLEWSGWYNFGIAQRLLGHYRLFQHFRKDRAKYDWDIPVVNAYILHYRATHGFKYSISRLLAVTYSAFTRNEYFLVAEVAAFNRMLVNEMSDILKEFLSHSEDNFDEALTTAIQEIYASPFFQKKNDKSKITAIAVAVNISTETNNYTTHNHNNDYSDHSTTNIDLSQELHLSMQPANTKGAKGKQKGVFSKHQVLILLDLLTSTQLEEMQFGEVSYRMKSLAEFLQALTGKSRESWLKELSTYKKTGLYKCHTREQSDNLIRALSNLATICEKAGFKSIADKAKGKICDLW